MRARHVPRRLRPRPAPVWALTTAHPVTREVALDMKRALRASGIWPAVVLGPGMTLARLDKP